MQPPPTIRYARADDGADIAYWTLGRGPALVWMPNPQLSHALSEWNVDGVRRFYQGAARSHTVVRLDPRGGGLSSRGRNEFTIDAYVRDLEAVVRELALERFALVGSIAGGPPAIAYSARHADRVSHLILWCTFASHAAHGRDARMQALFTMAATDWELFRESMCHAAMGFSDTTRARQWGMVLEEATTQEEFLAYLEARVAWDVSPLLTQVTAPTLVLFDPGNALAREEPSRQLAAEIPDARLLRSASEGGFPDGDALATIRAFVLEGASGPVGELTARETEILAQLATGASNTEIAERLFISVNTVTRHLTHIYAKLGAKGRAQAVRFALERGLRE